MEYERIWALTEDDLKLADSEAPALVTAIADYRGRLPAESWSAFQTRVAREWAIETGQIEGLYQFDRGLTITLIQDGITASRIPPAASFMSPEQVHAILLDHLTTLEGLFAFVKGDRPLSKSYIHELHQALLSNQDTHLVYAQSTKAFSDRTLVKGRYKEQPNNPTRPDGSLHHYCPPEHVESEMDRLIELYREQERAGVSPEIRAAWLHHAFTHIHPYSDGNGRVARALATLVLIKAGLMPLVVPTAEKLSVYMPALEAADAHVFGGLVTAFRRWQHRLVVDLSQRVEFGDAKRATTVSDFLLAVEHDMLRKEVRLPKAWSAAEARADQLQGIANTRFHQVASGLNASAQPTGWRFAIRGESDNGPVRSLLSDVGFELGSGPALGLSLDGATPVLVRFTVGRAGARFRGLYLAALTSSIAVTHRLVGHPFLIAFAEPEHEAIKRFNLWLEAQLLEALNEWRKLNLEEKAYPADTSSPN